MAKSAPPPLEIAKTKRTFHIVASRFNAQYVDALLDHVLQELGALAPRGTIFVHRVPGSFEIPVVARELAIQNEADAIIAAAARRGVKVEVAEQFHRRPLEQIKLALIRAGMEGLCYGFRKLFENMVTQAGFRPPELRAVGGGTRIRALQALKADPVTSTIPVFICSASEVATRGWEEYADGCLLKPVMYEDFMAALAATTSHLPSDAAARHMPRT